jgi:hypothetical protein
LSPILVRPVREQLEHDRVIRLLQADLAKKKVEVGINPGAEQNSGVAGGGRKEFPDAVLYATDKGRKLIGVVEVETTESVNHLEAMSQWAHLAKLKVPFHLYVPTASVDAARRLSQDHAISVTEIWSYHQIGEQFKFTLIYPPPGRGKAAGMPRTVSVASIRVEPRVDPTADGKDRPEAAAGEITAGGAAGAKGVSPRPRVIPAKVARVVEPVKAAPVKAPVKAPPVKATLVKATPGKAMPAVRPVKEAIAKAPVKAPAEAAKAKPAKPAAAKAAPPANALKTASRGGRNAVAAPARPSPRSAPRSSSPAVRGTSRKAVQVPARGKAAPGASAPSRGAKSRPAPPRKPSSKRR